MRLLLGMMIVLSLAGCAPSTDDWIGQLKNSDVVKRREAIRELGSRPAEAAQVVPALTEALRDESAYVRRDAALALAKFAQDAKEAVPALTAALKDKDHNVRLAAGTALKKIDAQAASKAGIH
jgi:HEAT repeat protein